MKVCLRKKLLYIFTIFFTITSFTLHGNNPTLTTNAESRYSTVWVDSVFSSLSTEQRIAQLLMIRVLTNQNEDYYRKISNEVKKYNLGGLAFFKGGPMRQAKWTNHFQELASTPMMIAMDAEWGPAMRLDSTIVFPRQMTLGAISDENQIYQMGMEIGRQLKRLGVHINFAPVVDVNNNPDNPVINSRSFGESRYNVTDKGLAYMHGMQDAGIIACAKHFPGHGDTDTDSHLSLPLIKHSREEIDSVHLYPFRKLIESGLKSVMVAHLQIPSLEPQKDLASTLSHNIVTGLLQNEMGFEGLVITDALDMKGVSNYFKSGELELKALLAGNDILLLPENVEAAINSIKKALDENILPEEYLNNKVKKILYYKQMAGLDNYQPVITEGLYEYLNNKKAKQNLKRLVESSVTLIRNENDLIPLRGLGSRKIAVLSIGSEKNNAFQKMLGNYFKVDQFSIEKEYSPQQFNSLLTDLEAYNLIIVGIHNNSMFLSNRYGIDPPVVDLINSLSARQQVVLSLFANPYSLEYFGKKVLDLDAIVVAYQDGVLYEEAAAQVIFGGIPSRGRLSVSVPPYFPSSKSIYTPDNFRIRFSDPEDIGLNKDLINRIDSIALSGINEQAYPGCQIAVIKDGTVIYNKAFGYHTYEKQTPVKTTDLYDLASVTKIAATTAAVMRLTDEGRLDLSENIGSYLPWLKKTDKEKINLREMLAHQGRLRSWIPFYLETIENGECQPSIYQPQPSGDFSLQVADKLFMNTTYLDTIYSRIVTSPLLERNIYRYSDLGFIMLADIIKNQTGQNIDQYTNEVFYKPLGLSTMTYNPLDRFEPERIVPSEVDTVFRRQVIRGYVNDPAAAMLGGVAGHAGLFSNALDLAVVMQMFLQKGDYGGTRYINETTVEEFTRVQFAGNENRRALGFDKPNISPSPVNPCSIDSSPFSFGHSGFTGSYTWVDPQENLVYVFLSNRTYPDASNRKIIELNIRTDIHQVIYDTIYFDRYMQTARLP